MPPLTHSQDLESAKRQVVAAGIASTGIALSLWVYLLVGPIFLLTTTLERAYGLRHPPFESLLRDGSLVAAMALLQVIAAIICALVLVRRPSRVGAPLGSWIATVSILGGALIASDVRPGVAGGLVAGAVTTAIGALAMAAWRIARPAA